MSKVTIPSKHYVGMQVRGTATIPLGFMTPWGDDAAAKKRMSTVDMWAAGRTGTKLESMTIDNTPMLGFKLTSDIRRGNYGAADKWRIEDPRGFELEITSSNLAEVMGDTTIERGEILEKCVWARSGNNNLLLTVESDYYKNAVAMTTIVNSSASWKDVKIGHKIVLQNGISGTYLGKMHYVTVGSPDYDKKNTNTFYESGKSAYFILTDTTPRSWPAGTSQELHIIGSPKLSAILDSSNVITVAESEAIVNASIQSPSCYVQIAGYRTVIMAASAPIKSSDWKLTLVKSNIDITTLKTHTYGARHCFVKTHDGTIGTLHIDYHNKYEITVIQDKLLSTGVLINKLTQVRSGYFSSTTRNTAITINIQPSDVVEVYELEISATSKEGVFIQTRY